MARQLRITQVRKMEFMLKQGHDNHTIAREIEVHPETVARFNRANEIRTEEQSRKIRSNSAINGKHSTDAKLVKLLSKKIEVEPGVFDFAYSLRDIAKLAEANRQRVVKLCKHAKRSKKANERVGKRREIERKIELNRTPELQYAIDLIERTTLGSFDLGQKLRTKFPNRRRQYYQEVMQRAREHLGLGKIPRTTKERQEKIIAEFMQAVEGAEAKNGILHINDLMRRSNGFLTRATAQQFLAEYMLSKPARKINLAEVVNATELSVDRINAIFTGIRLKKRKKNLL